MRLRRPLIFRTGVPLALPKDLPPIRRYIRQFFQKIFHIFGRSSERSSTHPGDLPNEFSNPSTHIHAEHHRAYGTGTPCWLGLCAAPRSATATSYNLPGLVSTQRFFCERREWVSTMASNRRCCTRNELRQIKKLTANREPTPSSPAEWIKRPEAQ